MGGKIDFRNPPNSATNKYSNNFLVKDYTTPNPVLASALHA